jgi:hypothetical protein
VGLFRVGGPDYANPDWRIQVKSQRVVYKVVRCNDSHVNLFV